MLRSLSRQAIVLPLALLGAVEARAQAFDEGTNAVNIGLGLPGFRYNYGLNGGAYRSSPAFSVSFDRGLKRLGPDVLGVGGFVGFQTERYTNSYWYYGTVNEDYRWTNLKICVRANYHLNWWHDIDNLDLYGGVATGFNIGVLADNSTRTDNGLTSSYDAGRSIPLSFPFVGGYAGVRYLFTDQIGVYAEAGYGLSLLHGGLTFKF